MCYLASYQCDQIYLNPKWRENSADSVELRIILPDTTQQQKDNTILKWTRIDISPKNTCKWPVQSKKRCLTSVLVCASCSDRILLTGWLKHQTSIFHRSRGWTRRIRVSAWSDSWGRRSSWSTDECRLVLHMKETGSATSLSLPVRILIPSRDPTLMTLLLPKVPTSKYHHIKTSIYGFWGTQTFSS